MRFTALILPLLLLAQRLPAQNPGEAQASPFRMPFAPRPGSTPRASRPKPEPPFRS